jgi:hypothetical protein
MSNHMQEQIRLNPILSDPQPDLLNINAEVIRLQDEAAQKPDHWLHDGLKSHFEEIQQQLSDLKR